MTDVGQLSKDEKDLFNSMMNKVVGETDRLFLGLLWVEWMGAIIWTFVYSPLDWHGKQTSVHIHVWAAIFLGGLINALPFWLILRRTRWDGTGQVVGVAQLLWSGLLIHLSGGQIETHFHIFVSLAVLAFYRDVRVLIAATMVTTIDHVIRGYYWPQSIYGVADPQHWRFATHVFWVLFEDFFLVRSIQDSRRDMKRLAGRQIQMERINATVEEAVAQRTAELAATSSQYRSLLETAQAIPWQVDTNTARFTYVGPQAHRILGYGLETFQSPNFITEFAHPDDDWQSALLVPNNGGSEHLFRLRARDGRWIWMKNVPSQMTGDVVFIQGIMLDVTKEQHLEVELRHAQKLESVGRLAAGVAHEINTPIQFVSDSVNFVREAANDLLVLFARYREIGHAVLVGQISTTMVNDVVAQEEELDLDYILEQLPLSLARSLDGLSRVATIVRSMKEFAHPDAKEKSPSDLNHAIETTLNMARNEYKYVADVETRFGDLPSVSCRVSEVSQVLLNLIINAAHAVADVVTNTGDKGKIVIVTRQDGDHAVIEISDTGGGIPEGIRTQIFDPFFTTKEVGRGTGQGLAIARSVIVEKHQGTLSFDSVMGVGTTFTIRLPIHSSAAEMQS